MAIARNKKGNLVETKIIEEKIEKPSIKNLNEEKVEKIDTKPKKRGFFGSTIDELKKSEWPSWNYVIKWGTTIVVFTAIFSVCLGFFDHAFTNGIKFVDCTSAKGRNQNTQDCSTEFLEQMVGKK